MSKRRKSGAKNHEAEASGVYPQQEPQDQLIGRHLCFGWWSLLVFLSLGIVLESLHGFKVDWYVNVSSETRQMMWRLAHAHGTLLAVVHVAFGCTLHAVPALADRLRKHVSWTLIAASLLLPLGFFLGGVITYENDPGLGILLVPVGAILLFVAVLLTALALKKMPAATLGRSADRRGKRR